MAIELFFSNFVITTQSEKSVPINLHLVGGDIAVVIFSRDFYDKTFLDFLHLLHTNVEGDACFCGKAFSEFSEEDILHFKKIFSSVSIQYPMISNLKVIENVYLPLFYHKNINEKILFDRAYELLVSLGIEKKFNLLPAFLSSFEKKLTLLARIKLLEPDIIYYQNIFNDMDKEKKDFLYNQIINFHGSKEGRISIITMRTEKDLDSVDFHKINKIIKI